MKRKAPGGRGREPTLATDLYPPPPLHFHIRPFFAFIEYKIQQWKKKKKHEKRAFISPVREPSGSNTFKLTSKMSWGIFCYSFFLLPFKAFSSFLTRCRRHTAHFLSITPCSRTTKLYCASQVPPRHFFRDFHKQSIKVCWQQWYTTINNDQRNIHSILNPCSYFPILFPCKGVEIRVRSFSISLWLKLK